MGRDDMTANVVWLVGVWVCIESLGASAGELRLAPSFQNVDRCPML